MEKKKEKTGRKEEESKKKEDRKILEWPVKQRKKGKAMDWTGK